MDKIQARKIYEVYQEIGRIEQLYREHYGLCLKEALVLCYLADEEEMQAGELGKVLGMTQSNASKVISSVEKKGYIRRKVGKVDKREMYFTLSAKGRGFMSRLEACDVPVSSLLAPIIKGNNNY
jgi:DNA-binding MarR family transcriptional regulator